MLLWSFCITFFVKFGPIFITKSLKCIRNFCLVIDIFFLKAYFLYASVIVLLLVNNFRYGIPDKAFRMVQYSKILTKQHPLHNIMFPFKRVSRLISETILFPGTCSTLLIHYLKAIEPLILYVRKTEGYISNMEHRIWNIRSLKRHRSSRNPDD